MSFEKLKQRLVLDSEGWDPGDGQKSGASHDNAAHNTLLDKVKAYVKESKICVSNHYDNWDYNDLIFRSRRVIDKEDRAAALKGNTAKMIVPLSFSQIMTFVAFCTQTLQQNKRFYELEPTSSIFNALREPLELVLERDIRRNNWTAFLVQFFLDIGRFGLGCAEVEYDETIRQIRLPQTTTVAGPFGQPVTKQTNDYVPITTFKGNRIRPISPYRFYPDYRIPLTDYQNGEFCGSEEMWTMSRLRSSTLDLFNVDQIPKLVLKEFEERKQISRVDEIPIRQNTSMSDGGTLSPDQYMKHGSVIITKMVCDIIPNDFEVGKDKPLGKEKFPLRYIVWYANDKTIVRFDEATYLHGQFPYICAQYVPDQHKPINEGLADVCDQIAEYITWLANTHKASQANALESKWVVDPAGIDIKGLESRSPYLFLKKDKANMGVDRYIKQFTTTDVTANALSEIAGFKELLEGVTGLSGFMQGQSSPGRRSATQDQVVTNGAAARGKTCLGTIWDSAFVPLGKQFIANNRQDMDLETFQAIVGDNPCGELINPQTGVPWQTQEIFALFQGDPQQIALDEHFFVYDGTLPSEKNFLAQSLQEIFIEMLQNPAIAQVMGYGPVQFRQLFQDIYNLRGVTSSRLPAPTTPTIAPPQQGQVPPPQGVPPNLIPMLENGTEGTASESNG